MRLSERLKKIESKVPTEKKIMLITYGAELTQLSYGGDLYNRLENESKKEFISRVLTIVKQNIKPNGYYLVGNF